MKTAAIYARVSSDLQKKEGTIESQLSELRRQIEADGNLLIKEYVDNGYSGAQLDRPAMDQLRKDIRTELFEVIYFLNTDRIARETTYQTIIIGEILKYKKQIIINGQDYVHNPENKFTLTVLGAVAELERAKITERSMRGKAHKLLQGTYGGGFGLFGYTYITKTPLTKGYFVINEEQAKVVREAFTEYAKGTIGFQKMSFRFEQAGYKTKNGKVSWNPERIRLLLGNSGYMGKMCFNQTRTLTEYANPMSGITKTTTKHTKRPESERIYLPIPPIVSEELFYKVQKRLQKNKMTYRNLHRTELLTGIIKCGICERSYRIQRLHRKRPLKRDPDNIYHMSVYACSWQVKMRKHLLSEDQIRCTNKRVTGSLIEEKVWEMFNSVFCSPETFKAKTLRTAIKEDESTKRLTTINKEIDALLTSKRETLSTYSQTKISHKEYVKQNTELDNKLRLLDFEKADIIKNKPIQPSEKTVNVTIKKYCENTYSQYLSCNDPDSKREFILQQVNRIIYFGDTFKILGTIPIPSSEEKILFEFEGEITNYDRHKRRLSIHKTTSSSSLSQKKTNDYLSF